MKRIVLMMIAAALVLSAAVVEMRAAVLLTTTVVTFDPSFGNIKHVCQDCEAVAGATMEIHAVAGGTWEDSGTTDSAGKVTFDIPSGVTQVTYTVTKDGYVPFTDTVFVRSRSRKDSGVVDLRPE